MAEGSPPNVTMRLTGGVQLNGIYEIDCHIASGGMGDIYKGHAIQTGDTVAIKVMRHELAEDPNALALFRKEASALHSLYHEAIIRYFLFTVEPKLQRPYLAMEFVEGLPLSDILKRGPLSFDAVWGLKNRMAAGLHAAHARGIIHRDVTPDNILVPEGDVGKAKIIDFGIARSLRPDAASTVIGSGFAGKFKYVSPEQFGMFGGDVTAKSDIYSLGLVLAEALAGRPIDMGNNHFESIERRRSVPDLAAIDARIRPLLADMLQPNPADRLASMMEVAERALAAAAPPPPPAPAQGKRLPPAPQLPPKAPEPAPRARPKTTPPREHPAEGKRLSPVLLGTAALVLAAVVGGGAFYLLAPQSVEAPPAPPSLQTAGPAGSASTQPPSPAPRPQAAAPAVPEPLISPPPPHLQPPTELALATPPSVPPPPVLIAPPPVTVAPPPAIATPPSPPATPPLPPAANSAPADATQPPQASRVPPAASQPSAPARPPASAAVPQRPAAPPPVAATPARPDRDQPNAFQLPPGLADALLAPPPTSRTRPVTNPARPIPPSPPAQRPPDPPAANAPSAAAPPAATSATPAAPAREPPPAQPSAAVAALAPTPAAPPAASTPGPSAGPPSIEKREQIALFASQYDGGECFLVLPVALNDSKPKFEGYSASRTAFEVFDVAFTRANNLAPDVGVRLVTQAQCPALTFLSRIRSGAAAGLRLELSSSELRAGETLTGTLAGIGSGDLAVLLVSDSGTVHDITRLLTTEGDVRRFSLTLPGRGPAGSKQPYLLVAVTTAQPVDALHPKHALSAQEFFGPVQAETLRPGQAISGTAKYFRIER